MTPETPSRESKRIFISYFQGSPKSKVIVDELKRFFANWQIECRPIEEVATSSDPQDVIYEYLGISDYFIQLVTDHSYDRSWLHEEWQAAKTLALSRTKPKMHKPILLFTNETPWEHPSFSVLKTAKDQATLKAANITNSNDVHALLYGILLETDAVKSPKGRIELPTFCSPSLPSEKQIPFDTIKSFFLNFSQANSRGLECVYPNREALSERLKVRLSQLQKGQLVRMLGITLHTYVLPGEGPNVGISFREAIDKGARAQLLLLERDCPAARERAGIESSGMKYEESRFWKDSVAVTSFYHQDGTYEGKVEIQFYKTPYVSIVLFDDEAYVEIYHLGSQIGTWNTGGNMCGHVPILVITKRTDGFYDLFDSHFQNVWDRRKSAE